MRKSATKIVKAVLGFTMAIGAVVGTAMSGSETKPIFATEGDTAINTSFSTSAYYYIKATNSGTNYYLSGTTGGELNKNVSWGTCTTSAPFYKFRISGSTATGSSDATITASTVISGTTYYLKGLTSGNFNLSTSSSSLKLKTSGEIYESGGSYRLRYNHNGGSGGLRWYNKNTGVAAYFVEAPSFGTLDHIKIASQPTISTFAVGETFSSAGLTLTGYDAANETAAETQTYTSGFTTDYDGHTFVAGDIGLNTVTVTYSGKTITYTILVDAEPNFTHTYSSNSVFGSASYNASETVTHTPTSGPEYITLGGYNYNSGTAMSLCKTAGMYFGNNEEYKISEVKKYINKIIITTDSDVSSKVQMTEGPIALSEESTIVPTKRDGNKTLIYEFSGENPFFKFKSTDATYINIKNIKAYLGSTMVESVISSVSASINSGTYYTGSNLSASDFSVTVHWTGGKSDTHPTSGFTWKVNGVLNGTLSEGNNSVVIIYEENESDPFNVIGTSIHATSVAITQESVSVDIGKTIELEGSVNPVNAVETIAWSSSDENVATVNSSGIVTGVAVGNATITATAGGYTDTCEVTVFSNLDLSDKSFVVTKPASVQTEPSTALIGSHTLNLINAYNKKDSTTYAYMMFGNKELKTSDSLISNKTPISGPITKIIFTIKAGSSGSAVYKAMLSSTEVTSPVTSATYTRTGVGTIEITSDAANDLRYFAISSTNSSANGQLESVKICYEQPTAEGAINDVNTRSTLAYKYTAEPLAITAAAIRFGGLISKTAWDRLDDEQEIQGYGILLSTSSFLGANELKTKYNAVDGTSVKKFDHAVAVLPDEANVEQTNGLLETHYVWNLFKNVPLDQLTTEYVAVAYIRTASGVVFLGQAAASVDGLADAMLASDEYDDASFGGSLKYLSELN